MIILSLELLLLWLSCLSVGSISAVYNRTETLPGCQPKCGNVDIPYPFGIGANCSFAEWTKVNCNTTFHPPKPFLGNTTFEIAHLSPTEIRIKNVIATTCYNESNDETIDTWSLFDLAGMPYTFSSSKNKLFAIGCDTFLSTAVQGNSQLLCRSSCNKQEEVIEGSCVGIGCCQTSIPKGLTWFRASVGSYRQYRKVRSFDICGSAFMGEQDVYKFKVLDFTNTAPLVDIPIVINFVVNNQTCKEAEKNATTFACKDNSYCYDSTDSAGYICSCNQGYEGNPYLQNSCQDVNECEDRNNNPCEGICTNTNGGYTCSCPSNFYGDGTKNGTRCTRKDKKHPVLELTLGLGLGLFFLLTGGSWLLLSLKKRKHMKLKEYFFQKNGGLLLKQQISPHEGVELSTKIFTTEELRRATNNYDQNRVIGQGGSGTVYKGILPDLTVVAIKKARMIHASQIGEFVNEVVILTQINHRNVVKLLGCCLETEVPVLIYEFVSNGTLFYHLHKRRVSPSLSWADRLRIAAEIASALAYLHSAASVPIFHRDVKSANILLDDNYTAKVADFGASRLNTMDETQISTLVQGTIGYLDPEYFHTGQLTEKSDVYSFGVVLAELLTGEKPVCFDRSQGQTNLATHFIFSMKEKSIAEIFDPSILIEADKDQLYAVARLANKCLCVSGDERPSMKEVAMDLERLRSFRTHQRVPKNSVETARLSKDVDLYTTSLSDVYTRDYGTSGRCSSLGTEMMRSMELPRSDEEEDSGEEGTWRDSS